jgi:hypothetical protein
MFLVLGAKASFFEAGEMTARSCASVLQDVINIIQLWIISIKMGMVLTKVYLC